MDARIRAEGLGSAEASTERGMQGAMTRIGLALLALLLAAALVTSLSGAAGAEDAENPTAASSTTTSSLGAAPAASNAAPDKNPLIVYSLEAVAFDDGTTVEGRFTFDSTMDCVSTCPEAYRDVAVTTSAGSTLPEATYSDRGLTAASGTVVLEVAAMDTGSEIFLTFVAPLGSALVVGLVPGSSFESHDGVQREVVSGQVVGVRPAPPPTTTTTTSTTTTTTTTSATTTSTTTTTTTLPAPVGAPTTTAPPTLVLPATTTTTVAPSAAATAVAPSTTTTTVAPPPPSPAAVVPPTTTTTSTTTPPPDPAPATVPDVTFVTPGSSDSTGEQGGRLTEPIVKVPRLEVVREITFPIVGPVGYYAGFGACRDGCRREHHGIDLMTYGWKGLPVVAAHDGVVTKINPDVGNGGCAVRIDGDDGWQTRYLHMNNDDPATDNGRGGFEHCIVPGLAVGERVEEGQLIGWVGDSGNAEGTAPHVHFEIRTPTGLPIDAYESLKASNRISFRRIDGQNPIELAVRVSGLAYPAGAGVTYVTSAVDVDPWFSSGVSSGRLDGPLLVTSVGSLSVATRAEIERLGPDRIVVVGDRIDDGVVSSLTELAPVIERVMVPLPMPVSSGDGIERAQPNIGNRIAPFSLVILEGTNGGDLETQVEPPAETVTDEDASAPAPHAAVPAGLIAEDAVQPVTPESVVQEPDPEAEKAEEAAAARSLAHVESLIESVPTLMLGVEHQPTEEETEAVGRSPYEVPKNAVRSGQLYHETEAGYVHKPASYPVQVGPVPEPASETTSLPNGGVIVVLDSDDLAATFAFLDSLVDAPVMPLWR